MQYWLKWNELLEEFCVWRYRLEDLPWLEFLKRIDHSWEPLPDISNDKMNTRKDSMPCRAKEFTELTWGRLHECNGELSHKIYEKHLEYGYSPARDREETLQISGQPETA